jgi:hypothetical protein
VSISIPSLNFKILILLYNLPSSAKLKYLNSGVTIM